MANTTLSRCRGLQELEFPIAQPKTKAASDLLSSITSTGVQKVTLVIRGCSRDDINWEILDWPLCRLAEQSECKHELEVIFRFVGARVMKPDQPTEESNIVRSLANSRGKGRMRVVRMGEDGGESVIYSSNANGACNARR